MSKERVIALIPTLTRRVEGRKHESDRFYAKEDVRVEDVPAPNSLGDSQVLIKPLTCGICGTDLHEFAGGPIVTPATQHKFTGAVLPQILGHEFSAEVVDIGRDVKRVRKGDRISIQPLVMPLDDYYSRRGLNHLSPSMGCIGLSWAWGGMGELAVINDYNANLIPDNVTDEQGALVEPTAVALYGVDRSKVTGGSTVLVTGAGPIGALVVLICSAVGASKIFVSEPNANRRKHIESLGVATAVLDPKIGQRHRLYPREYRGGRRRRRRDRMFGYRSSRSTLASRRCAITARSCRPACM